VIVVRGRWLATQVIQSVTYLVKYERPDIAIFYANARLANDVRLAPGRLVTPYFAGARAKAGGARPAAQNL